MLLLSHNIWYMRFVAQSHKHGDFAFQNFFSKSSVDLFIFLKSLNLSKISAQENIELAMSFSNIVVDQWSSKLSLLIVVITLRGKWVVEATFKFWIIDEESGFHGA